MSVSGDLVADALVREYLAKAGLKETLKLLDQEKPRSPDAISNRSTLRKAVGLEKYSAKLKKRHPDEPLPTTLEMLVNYTQAKIKAAEAAAESEEVSPGKAAARKPPSRSAPSSDNSRSHPPLPVEDEPSPPPRPKQGFGFSSDSFQSDSLSRNATRLEPPELRPTTNSFGSRSSELPLARNPVQASQDQMVMEDFDEDFDADFSHPAPTISRQGVSAKGGTQISVGEPLSPDEMKTVKEKLFGTMGAPDSWKQGLFFKENVKGLEYGLVQKQGGPCGVLAAVQAQMLCSLATKAGTTSPKVVDLTRKQYEDALADGIAQALWKASSAGLRSANGAYVVNCSERSTQGMTLDMCLRQSKKTRVKSLEEAQGAVRSCLGVWMEQDGWGLLLFLYSLVLSRGIQNIKGDMDEPNNSLMGAHGYCTQDLVNLIICGSSVTNVFNGINKLDEHTTLKGVPGQSKIGFLSLFEWYQYIEVGSYYKQPDVAVWVVCCESHFTCIFATDSRANENRRPFDLYYYDGLANQDEVIRFTVTRSEHGGHTARAGDTVGSRGKTEGDLTPPLEFVIETRWPGVEVNWNGAEPIL
uniref:Probable ubiquitin carboxyl-terminal hydrolase MINDY-4 n=1 Tax=Pyramimonas obovata TaxID=1411642 RepID=A0A7S0WEH1_9CHLO|mmetsp:Transcript_2373/g.4828  ORF Transcript_2373/g.4828 Transcript_2373/m.4828 type:complete len:583 (+) Transcript_2373:284-2032(+)|eukprot:CAMPEP_0118951788 /NCGR_PEP_ID=MMETSP1169-20130426/53725_1 /TAXON_ID=36882 /ORGANISM="Pyramimonas obovata, Strain CCMP722" /LENGTH=582 /DNA_ID=CAMNT_0006898919 /DNA_START=205 /DNA_END=1953 /DNA_ORIENTATION=+